MPRYAPYAALIAALGASAAAETLTFEADDSVIIVRGRDQYGFAIFEMIAPPGRMYQCIALDPEDRPLAVANTLSDMGEVSFPDLPVAEVARVRCREV